MITIAEDTARNLGHRLDLTDAAEGHRLSDTGHPGGKIVLHP